MPAHTVNAYYHPMLNEIVFPAGILQPPFFFADADDAVNYGAIGAVIGHEITHGFDDQGSHFDAGGRLRDWWTEADRTEFMRRAQVLVDQFDEYAVVDDLHVNGRLTLGENIADFGGLKIAHAALREALAGTAAAAIDGFSPEQRLLPVVGDGVAHELHGRVPATGRQDRPAFAGAGARERAALQPAGVRGRVRDRRSVTHGAQRGDPRTYLVAAARYMESGV